MSPSQAHTWLIGPPKASIRAFDCSLAAGAAASGLYGLQCRKCLADGRFSGRNASRAARTTMMATWMVTARARLIEMYAFILPRVPSCSCRGSDAGTSFQRFFSRAVDIRSPWHPLCSREQLYSMQSSTPIWLSRAGRDGASSLLARGYFACKRAKGSVKSCNQRRSGVVFDGALRRLLLVK
ncbi:hypothetical protein BC828DRAFT_377286 [Blastocladiella britannica]|nr:hypothetical protein BC828DRAFT_377286 [Blastocladiella britannica]